MHLHWLEARLDAQLQAWPRLWATMGPLVAPQVEALGMRLNTGCYATGLLVGELSVLWGLSWADWGVGESKSGERTDVGGR